MAIEPAAAPAQNLQPLPRRDTARPLADFAPRFKAAAQAAEPAMNTAAPGGHPVNPLPLAPMMPRTVAREAPARPSPVAEPTARPMAERGAQLELGAVPERLVNLLQETRGREALTARTRLDVNQAIKPLPETPIRPLPAAAPTPEPAREIPVQLDTLAATPRAALPERAIPRLPLESVNVEIRAQDARQSLQSALRERLSREAGGIGMPRTSRAILDARA